MTFQREVTAMVAHIKANVMTRAEAVDYLAEHYDRDRNYLRALVDYRMIRDQWMRREQRRAEYETRPAPREQSVAAPRLMAQYGIEVYGIEVRPWTSGGYVTPSERTGTLHEWMQRGVVLRARQSENEQEGGDTL